ncbi:MAG: DUF5916 domain-containing protein [Vicinamibacterales bacterium]
MARRGLVTGLVVHLMAAGAAAQAPDPATLAALPRAERVRRLRGRAWDITALHAHDPLVLDGRLDEPDWGRATPIDDLYQGQRNEGLPASERTEVRVLHDGRTLWIGFRAWDREPEKMKIRSTFRDEGGGADELVSVMIDAYHGHRTAVQLISNANGLVEDLLQTGESPSTRNHDWDAVWNAKGRVLPDGYEVEYAIPFASLRFDPPAPGTPVVFGIGFKRNIPRKNEESTWPFVANDSTWYRPAELGHLHGLDDVRPGRNFQLLPYVLGGRTASFGDAAGVQHRRDVGLDAKWSVTSGITADFTVHTDFAQEEVDVQQVNLTRFSLFFPEKRQFFLEGQQAFRFGVPRQADLVFTRRIGLSEAGTPVPVLGGARLSGRQGRTTVGAMVLQTDEDAGGAAPSQNFAVVRVKRDILARSSVGALVTSVQGGATFNRVVGADAAFYLGRPWQIEGWGAFVDRSAGGAGRAGGYGRLAYETDRHGYGYTFLGLGESFQPGVGFVLRPDSLQHTAIARWSPRPDVERIRQVHLTGMLGYITDTAGVPATRDRSVLWRTDFETGDAIEVGFTDTMENLVEPFRLRRDVTLPPGTYRFGEWMLKADSFRRRHLQLDTTVTAGGFFDGDRRSLQTNFTWKFMRGLGVTAAYTANWVDLPAAAFTTHVVSSRVQYSPRNDLAFLTLFQYNHDTRQVSSNVRVNWIPKPGTDVFLVYNETDLSRGQLAPITRSLTLKVNYLFQF